MSVAGRRRLWGWLSGAAVAAAAAPAVGWAQPAGAASTRRGVVFQVTEAGPSQWMLVLNNMRNLQAELGADGVEIELVAFGPGVMMLKADSPVVQPLAQALHAGMRAVACQHTMQAFKLTPPDMQAQVGFVPSGVTQVVRMQQQGWAYVRP